MLVTTTFTIEGHDIVEYKGVVRGIIVRSPTIAQGIVGSLKNVIGGHIGAYTEMCEQTRQQAYDLLLQHAHELGANAIVGMRYDASEVVSKSSATEVLCYGTAVVIRKSGESERDVPKGTPAMLDSPTDELQTPTPTDRESS